MEFITHSVDGLYTITGSRIYQFPAQVLDMRVYEIIISAAIHIVSP
jgi:hypothetical protein